MLVRSEHDARWLAEIRLCFAVRRRMTGGRRFRREQLVVDLLFEQRTQHDHCGAGALKFAHALDVVAER